MAGSSAGDGEGTAYTNVVAALLYLDRGDEASARRHAQRAAELDPWYMFLIRDHDLRKGDYATARARYAKAFPELFAKELPKLNDRDCLCSDRPGARAAAHRRGRAGQGAPRSQRSLFPDNSANGIIGLRDLGRCDPRVAREKRPRP